MIENTLVVPLAIYLPVKIIVIVTTDICWVGTVWPNEDRPTCSTALHCACVTCNTCSTVCVRDLQHLLYSVRA